MAPLGGHMQGIVPTRPRLVEIRPPVEVAFDLVQVPHMDGPVEIDGRGWRLAAGGEGQGQQHDP